MGTGSQAAHTGWTEAVDGDRNAFRSAVEPYLADLLDAAGHEVAYRRALGELDAADPEPVEVVAETLLQAWRQRRRRPAGMSLRAWLLALQHRVVERWVRREAELRAAWAVSLEERVPEPVEDDEESFWEWYQPDEVERYEDVLEDSPVLDPEEEAALLEEAGADLLAPRERAALVLHDVRGLSLREVAIALRLGLRETAVVLREARARLRAADRRGGTR